MPDLWMDVDAALAEVPVNSFPLIDDTDFKTREESVAYNAAGLDLIWHFVTPAGAYTATAVTPTTGGAYDWAHQDGGMYTIEIPASGGASINNDTEGFGWFTGFCTGVLPWRGPIIGFRAAGLNGLLIEDAFSTTRGLAGTALPNAAADAANGLPVSDAGGLDLDAKLANAHEITAARMGALTDWIDGGRLDLLIDAVLARLPAALVSGRMNASVGAMAANTLTATAIASNAITAAKIASSALSIAKFAADVGTTAYASNPIAKAIWERLLSATFASGSIGEKIQTAVLSAITEARLAELDAANIPADVDTIKAATLAASIRTALGLASANLDTQIGTLALEATLTAIKGATWSSLTDTLEALRDRGDAAWITATGFSTHDAANVKTAIEAAGSHLALIKAVTDLIPDAGALTTIGTDTARLTAARAQVLTDLIDGGRLDILIDAIKAVTDLLNAAHAEPTGAPAANETPLDKIAYIFAAIRNALAITASAKTFKDDAGATLWSKALSDDGTTYTEAEGA